MPVNKSIGIFGGTFDPVHFGHLYAATEVQAVFDLDETYLVPCATPVHRPKALATADQRLTMLQLAIEGFQNLKVDDRELKRAGESFTYDTVCEIHVEYPDAILYLIIGMDAFNYFTEWHNWKGILENANIIVMQRPGFSMVIGKNNCLKEYFVEDLTQEKLKCGGIFFQSIVPRDIAATKIRENLKNNLSIKSMVPAAVIAWLNSNPIYNF